VAANLKFIVCHAYKFVTQVTGWAKFFQKNYGYCDCFARPECCRLNFQNISDSSDRNENPTKEKKEKRKSDSIFKKKRTGAKEELINSDVTILIGNEESVLNGDFRSNNDLFRNNSDNYSPTTSIKKDSKNRHLKDERDKKVEIQELYLNNPIINPVINEEFGLPTENESDITKKKKKKRKSAGNKRSGSSSGDFEEKKSARGGKSELLTSGDKFKIVI